jgi:hypothetical protein
MMRRPLGLKAAEAAALAGPLKILVAVAAPDEGLASGAVLDQERHPRMLEFLDALLRGGEGRLPAVTEKLRKLAEDQGIDVATAAADIASGLRTALVIGARDVLLAELIAIVRAAGIEEALLQAAVSNLPVTPQGLARMLAGNGPGDVTSVTAAATRLQTCHWCTVFLMAPCWCTAGPLRVLPPSPTRPRI